MLGFKGNVGTACEIDLTKTPYALQSPALLAMWNLRLPMQHMLWDRYCLFLTHLRDLEGVPPARKDSDEVTHELVMLVVHPDCSEDQFNAGPLTRHLLHPVNHVCQIEAATDRLAFDCLVHMVKRLVSGDEFAEPCGIIGARERFNSSARKFLQEHRA